MKAQQLVANQSPLVANELATPEISGQQVLVRIRHCGVCHTDLHLHDGFFALGGERKLNLAQSLPLTLGHEIQGEIAALGEQVTSLKVGEQVAVYPWIGCGECALCKTEREHLCGRSRALGVSVDGGYAEYVVVEHSRYVLPIGSVDPQQAGLLMCSGISAYSALAKVAGAFDNDENVLIIGLGGLGMMALRLAQAKFGKLPMVADIDEGKLALAAKMGATTFNLNDEGIDRTIKKQTGGVAAVIDFVGAEATTALAGRVVGQAGHIVIVGLFGGMLQTPIPLLALRGTTIQGSYVGTLAEAREILKLAGSGTLEPLPVVEMPLAEANQAIEELRAGKVTGRVVLLC